MYAVPFVSPVSVQVSAVVVVHCAAPGAAVTVYPVAVAPVIAVQYTVAEAFPGFVRRFPDVGALASASPANVIRAWGALGYHRRAVALHRSARAIVRDHEGRVPADVPTLLEFPGIGPYTAAAVASIAFGVPVPAIDTNARKVIARLALGRDPAEAPAASIREAAASWVARDRPGDWNQAVMDLGREICRPVPRCERCPLATACRFRAMDHTGTGVREAGRRQPAFQGSTRQVRGAVVRELRGRSRAATIAALVDATGEPLDRVEAAVDALAIDGVVERTAAGRVRLPR